MGQRLSGAVAGVMGVCAVAPSAQACSYADFTPTNLLVINPDGSLAGASYDAAPAMVVYEPAPVVVYEPAPPPPAPARVAAHASGHVVHHGAASVSYETPAPMTDAVYGAAVAVEVRDVASGFLVLPVIRPTGEIVSEDVYAAAEYAVSEVATANVLLTTPVAVIGCGGCGG